MSILKIMFCSSVSAQPCNLKQRPFHYAGRCRITYFLESCMLDYIESPVMAGNSTAFDLLFRGTGGSDGFRLQFSFPDKQDDQFRNDQTVHKMARCPIEPGRRVICSGRQFCQQSKEI